MREICMSGSEGGGAKFNWPSLPLSRFDRLNRPTSFHSISCRVGYADRVRRFTTSISIRRHRTSLHHQGFPSIHFARFPEISFWRNC